MQILKIFKNAKIDKVKTVNHADQDSDFPDGIQFTKPDQKKEPKKPAPAQNKDAIPTEE